MSLTNLLIWVRNIVTMLVGGSFVPIDSAEPIPYTVTFAESWVGKFVGVIEAQPLLLLFCIIPLIFLGISAVRRLMNV